MSVQYSYNTSKITKTMTEEQFEQILDAILSGKYSWACVLILRFAGYNPLHYIPYRTYNRLTKDHRSNHQSESQTTADKKAKIQDLNYLESMPDVYPQISGGITTLEVVENLSLPWKLN